MSKESRKELVKALRKLEKIQALSIVQSQKTLGDSITAAQQIFSKHLVDFLHLEPDGLTPEEKQLIRTNQKIPAIKAVRTRTGLGLAEAKKKVDEWMRQNGIDPFGAQR